MDVGRTKTRMKRRRSHRPMTVGKQAAPALLRPHPLLHVISDNQNTYNFIIITCLRATRRGLVSYRQGCVQCSAAAATRVACRVHRGWLFRMPNANIPESQRANLAACTFVYVQMCLVL